MTLNQSLKALLHFGDKVLAIEIIPASPEELGLSKENPVLLQKGTHFDNDVYYETLGYAVNKRRGRTLNDYAENPETWKVEGSKTEDRGEDFQA